LNKPGIPLATQVALAQTMALNGALISVVRANPSVSLCAELQQALSAYEAQTLMLGFEDEAVAQGRACIAVLLETCLEQLGKRSA
jgi:parvulin-like peptidyl-prolyl isomerase